MARRKNTSNGLFEVIFSLPWWLNILIAVVLYFGIHQLAGMQIPPEKHPGAMSEAVIKQLIKGFAVVFQYLVPLIFIIGAIGSAANGRQRRSAFDMTSDRIDPWEGVPEGDLPSTRREPPLPDVDTRKWSLQLLQALEWARFEEVCAAYFEQLGFRTRRSSGGPDGGIDIHLFSNQDKTPGIIVQCKAWRKWRVGVDEIRAFFGVMTAEKISEGIFITSSEFSDDAKKFADGKNIHLIDGTNLLKKIKQLTLAQEDDLLKLATQGDFTTPSCPSCRVKLKLRQGKTKGNYFWGCSNFPKCRFILQAPKSG